MSAPSLTGWLVVGSTAAGSSGTELIEAVAGRLASAAPTEVAVTSSPDDLTAVLARCGDRVLVVVGGDGSAHLVVNTLEREGLLGQVVVGFVPLGTANDLATHLGMEGDAGPAADQLLGGHRRQIDVVRMTRRDGSDPEMVVNAAHAGLGIVAARRADPLKKVLGRLAYPVGVIGSAVTERGADIEIRLDGQALELEGPVLAVAVANGSRLGGVDLSSDALIDDGLLDVQAVPARPWTLRLRAVERAVGRSNDAVVTGRAAVVELEGDLGQVDADGELLDVDGYCRLEVIPGALTVLGPEP